MIIGVVMKRTYCKLKLICSRCLLAAAVYLYMFGDGNRLLYLLEKIQRRSIEKIESKRSLKSCFSYVLCEKKYIHSCFNSAQLKNATKVLHAHKATPPDVELRFDKMVPMGPGHA